MKIAAFGTALLFPLLSGPLLADPDKDESGHGYAAYTEAEREYWKRQEEHAREERKRREEIARERRKRDQERAREQRKHDRDYVAYPVYETYSIPAPASVPPLLREHIIITRDGVGGWINL